MNDSLPPELPDFDDPLGILRACHDRMLDHCELLEKLVPHIAEKGVDSEARSAASKVVNYFSGSAVHHHQDEEQDLFPILNRQSLKLAEIIYRLRQEHDALEKIWEALSADLKKASALAENPEFAPRVEAFCTQYRQHIDYENRELLGIAQHILSEQQLKDLGNAMARRRGIRR